MSTLSRYKNRCAICLNAVEPRVSAGFTTLLCDCRHATRRRPCGSNCLMHAMHVQIEPREQTLLAEAAGVATAPWPLNGTTTSLQRLHNRPSKPPAGPAAMPRAPGRQPLKRVALPEQPATWRSDVFGSLVGNACLRVPRRRRSAAPASDRGSEARWPSSSGSPEEVKGGQATMGLAFAAGSPLDERAIAGLLSLRTGSGIA